MEADFPSEFFAAKFAGMQGRFKNAVIHGLLIKEVGTSTGMIGHLTDSNTAPQGDIVLSGTAYYGTQIKGGRIIFEYNYPVTTRPSFDPVTGLVTVYAPGSQASTYIAALRSSQYMLLLYGESPSVDQAVAEVVTYNRI